MSNTISDPELYAEMAKPFATPAEAEAAMASFRADLRCIRKKHRIANVLTVPAVFYMKDDGTSDLAIGGTYDGDAYMAPRLARAAQEQWAKHADNLLVAASFERAGLKLS